MLESLYDKFKEWSDGGSVFIYSDPHFSDLDCYKLRFPEAFTEHKIIIDNKEIKIELENYSDENIVKWLDGWQIKRINSKISKNDTLIILGDILDLNYKFECVSKLRAGRKILIMGNHDTGASNYKRNFAKTSATIWDEGKKYVFVNEVPSINDNHLFDEVYEGPLFIGKRILLSHEPINFDFALNIHGHVHSKEKLKSDKCSFNACAEHINYTPVNLKSILISGIMKNIKDIHRDTIDNAIIRKSKRNEEVK